MESIKENIFSIEISIFLSQNNVKKVFGFKINKPFLYNLFKSRINHSLQQIFKKIVMDVDYAFRQKTVIL